MQETRKEDQVGVHFTVYFTPCHLKEIFLIRKQSKNIFYWFAALHMACIGQHADTVKTLLQLGLRDTEDNTGNTARQYAIKTNIKEVFESLEM